MLLEFIFHDKRVVIENDGDSVWAYLVGLEELKPKTDVYVCSASPLEPQFDNTHVSHGNPPKLYDKYASALAYQSNLKKKDFEVVESIIGDAYCIHVRDIPFAILSLDSNNRFSKAISSNCGFGSPWNEERYRRIFS